MRHSAFKQKRFGLPASGFLLIASGLCAAPLTPGVFPPLDSGQRIMGTLTEADFIHRTGQLRTVDAGALVEFALTPFARVRYLNAEADLRDVPLGTVCEMVLLEDARGRLNQAVALQAQTAAEPAATEEQRKKHNAFLKARGLAAWIDRVEGKNLTVTFFGDPAGMEALFKDEGIVPEQWAKEHRRVAVAVANEELRTYNPPVDNKGALVQEIQTGLAEACGCSGQRWVIQPDLLLEGFRKGRVVRIFVHPGWPIEDMPYGEGLYSEVFGVNPSGPEANQFPFRTDFGNEHLPWYQLKPNEFPPLLSEHRISGELTKVDLAHRTGQFRTDRTGEVVDFALLPYGSVMVMNAEADLSELALGSRCQFLLHPDEQGAFTKASAITDEFTRLASEKLTYRLNRAQLDQGILHAAWKVPPVENDKSRMEQPPDYGQCELAVDASTRVWKNGKPGKLEELTVGEEFIVNQTGRTATSRGRCLDLWVGAETITAATVQQRAKHDALLKEHGLPAWIDRVEGNKLTLTLINGPQRNEFKQFFDDNFKQGQEIKFAPADATLNLRDPQAPLLNARFTDNQNIPLATHGCSGTRIAIEQTAASGDFHPGGVLRLFAPGWPGKE